MSSKQLSQKAINILLSELLAVRKEKMSISYYLHEDLLQSLVYLKVFLSDIASKENEATANMKKTYEVLDDSIKKIREFLFNSFILSINTCKSPRFLTGGKTILL